MLILGNGTNEHEREAEFPTSIIHHRASDAQQICGCCNDMCGLRFLADVQSKPHRTASDKNNGWNILPTWWSHIMFRHARSHVCGPLCIDIKPDVHIADVAIICVVVLRPYCLKLFFFCSWGRAAGAFMLGGFIILIHIAQILKISIQSIATNKIFHTASCIP